MNKKQKKYLKIGAPIGVVALLIIISLVFLLGSSTTVASLTIESGDVQVDTGRGWTTAQDGMDISRNDRVRTLEGKAVLILYESVIVQMDENTEISLDQITDKNVKLYQESGSTWNKFTAISGLQSFEIETPNSVATVRGTEFWVDMQSVGVTEGNVAVQMNKKQISLTAGKKAVLEGESHTVKDIDESDIEKAIAKKQATLKHLKNLRAEEIDKHPLVYKMVKATRGWTDEEVRQRLERMDRGEYNEDELQRRVKLPAESIEKFTLLTKEIKRQNIELEEIKLKAQQKQLLERQMQEQSIESEERQRTQQPYS